MLFNVYQPLRHNLKESCGGDMIDPLVVTEGSTVPAGLEPDQGVGHGQDAEEQHHQQQQQVEVVVFRGLEHRLVRHVSHQDRPALDVEYQDQFDQIEERESRGHEESHPDHSLVVDCVQDVLRDIKLRVSGETSF